jgi:hypothetical protein
MRQLLVEKHGFQEKENAYGSFFTIEVSSMDSWQIKTLLQSRKYKYRCFDSRYERSTSYRKTFFDTHKGPYRCAYCGRRLRSENKIEVDHLVPVSKAKSSFGVRTWLHICGITNVNDHRNLVASCQKCNRKKSNKMGFWTIRGALGRFKIFWIMRDIIVSILLLFVALILMKYLPLLEWFQIA